MLECCWNRCWAVIPILAFCLLVGSAATLSANDFCLLSCNRSAYDARMELIDRAEREISIAYYAIDSGDVALTLLGRLRAAAARGVTVQLLVDGLMTRLPAEFEQVLLADGIKIRAYHPPLARRPAWMNRRLHYKLLVVDRQAMIIGSRNLEDSHFGLEERNFVDMDFLLRGEICQHATDNFCSLWNSSDVCSVDESHSLGLKVRNHAEVRTACRKDFVGTPSDCSPPICIENVGCVCLVHDRGTDKSARHFQAQVIALLDSAQHRIWIETPYPVLERPVKDALRCAIFRGVKVTLQSNSLGSADRTAPYAAYQNDKREYRQMGVRLVEYVGCDTLHTKVVLVDDQTVLIGSYNMDARSDRLNIELGVCIQDTRVCQVIEQQMRGRMRNSKIVQRNRLGLPEMVRGDASLFKCAQTRCRQWLVPLIRGSL
ncbi:phospholipase D-like domain-containing protein [Planctomycetaceae bacterium SH139]